MLNERLLSLETRGGKDDIERQEFLEEHLKKILQGNNSFETTTEIIHSSDNDNDEWGSTTESSANIISLSHKDIESSAANIDSSAELE